MFSIESIFKDTKMAFHFLNIKSPSAIINDSWQKLNNLPAGNRIFSALLSKIIPYSGSISPIVLKLGNGIAVVQLKDRRAVRNHLNCIHAIALANIGELSTGLVFNSQIPKNALSILVKFEINYLKKARGNLISEAIFNLPTQYKSEDEFKLMATIKNDKSEIVSEVFATWKIRLNN